MVDLFEDFELAGAKRMLTTPALVKALPLPERRLVGLRTFPDRVILVLQ